MKHELHKVSKIFDDYNIACTETKEAQSIAHQAEFNLRYAIVPMLKMYAEHQAAYSTIQMVRFIMYDHMSELESKKQMQDNTRTILSHLLFDEPPMGQSLSYILHGFSTGHTKSLRDEVCNVLEAVKSVFECLKFQVKEVLDELEESKPRWPFGSSAALHREYVKVLTDIVEGIDLVINKHMVIIAKEHLSPLMVVNAWEQVINSMSVYAGYSAAFTIREEL